MGSANARSARARPQSGHRHVGRGAYRRRSHGGLRMRGLSRNDRNTLLLLALPALFVAVFFVVPLLSSVAVSFGVPEVTTVSYQRLIDVPVYRAVYWRTIRIALIVTLVCVALGYPCAYYISTLNRKARIIAVGLITLPFMLS